MYTCTYLDACTNTTVCKHMHLVQMQHSSNLPIVAYQGNVSNQDQLEYYKRVTTLLIPLDTTTLFCTRQKIQQRTSQILEMCNSCQESHTLARVHICLGSALAEPTCSTKNQKREREASNLKSTTQPRFNPQEAEIY